VREEKLRTELPKQSGIPDYKQLHKSYLNSLRLGTQSPEYKKADKHIVRFIALIEKSQ